MQRGQHGVALARTERPRRGRPVLGRGGRARVPAPIQRRAAHPTRPTGQGHPHGGADLQGDPQQPGHFWGDRDDGLRLLEPALELGILTLEFGHAPDQRMAAGAAPLLRRQGGQDPQLPVSSPHVRCEEYSPSRRSSAPIWPGSSHASASCRIRSLDSAGKRRRTGFSDTSGSRRRVDPAAVGVAGSAGASRLAAVPLASHSAAPSPLRPSARSSSSPLPPPFLQ
jgi:hypothetical protein